MGKDLTDIPEQYKAKAHDCIISICDSAEDLAAIIAELGCDNIVIGNVSNTIEVTVKVKNT